MLYNDKMSMLMLASVTEFLEGRVTNGRPPSAGVGRRGRGFTPHIFRCPPRSGRGMASRVAASGGALMEVDASPDVESSLTGALDPLLRFIGDSSGALEAAYAAAHARGMVLPRTVCLGFLSVAFAVFLAISFSPRSTPAGSWGVNWAYFGVVFVFFALIWGSGAALRRPPCSPRRCCCTRST